MWKVDLPYEEKNQMPFTGSKWKCKKQVPLSMPLSIIPYFTLCLNKWFVASALSPQRRM